jgi:hypothetical protein
MRIRGLDSRKTCPERSRRNRFSRKELARHLWVLGGSLLSLALALAFDLHPDLVALTALPIALGSLIMTLTIVLDMQTRGGDNSPRCVHLWKS